MRNRPTGISKRPSTYVPPGPARDCLMSMSKADLAELVWDYALRTVGEDAPLDEIIGEIVRTADILAAWNRRKPTAARP